MPNTVYHFIHCLFEIYFQINNADAVGTGLKFAGAESGFQIILVTIKLLLVLFPTNFYFYTILFFQNIFLSFQISSFLFKSLSFKSNPSFILYPFYFQNLPYFFSNPTTIPTVPLHSQRLYLSLSLFSLYKYSSFFP